MKTTNKKEQPKKADGSFENPILWAPPYPASKVVPQELTGDEDKDGDPATEETVFVKASVNQDIIVNGKKYSVGVQTIPCFIAHAHPHAVSTPKE